MKHILFVFVLLCLPAALFSQGEWIRQSSGSTIGVEYLRPVYIKNEFVNLSGSTLLLNGRIAVGSSTFLALEVPYVTSLVEYSFQDVLYDPTTGSINLVTQSFKNSKSSIGNVYLGVELGRPESSWLTRIGLSLPTFPEANSFAGSSGYLGDFMHLERYASNLLVLSVNQSYQPVFDNGIRLSLGLGSSVWSPTGNSSGTSEIMLDYSGGIGYDGDVVRVILGMKGRLLVTGSYLIGDRKSLNQMGAELSFRIGSIRPGVTIGRTLDSDFTTAIRYTLGGYVRVEL